MQSCNYCNNDPGGTQGISHLLTQKLYETIFKITECPELTFGEKCTGKCHCDDQKDCDRQSRACNTEQCEDGWVGHPACQTGNVINKVIFKSITVIGKW